MRPSPALILLLVLGAATAAALKVEHVEEVCALTGASRRYNQYFSLIRTSPVYADSWVERTLISHGNPVPEHRWVRTMGDTWTVFGFTRRHAKAPATYGARGWTESMLRENFSEAQILQLAKEFASGDREQQVRAENSLLNLK